MWVPVDTQTNRDVGEKRRSTMIDFEQKPTAKGATYKLLDRVGKSDTVFTGGDLHRAVMFMLPDSTYHYPSTILRYMRLWRRDRGKQVVCVNKPESKYKVI